MVMISAWSRRDPGAGDSAAGSARSWTNPVRKVPERCAVAYRRTAHHQFKSHFHPFLR